MALAGRFFQQPGFREWADRRLPPLRRARAHDMLRGDVELTTYLELLGLLTEDFHHQPFAKWGSTSGTASNQLYELISTQFAKRWLRVHSRVDYRHLAGASCRAPEYTAPLPKDSGRELWAASEEWRIRRMSCDEMGVSPSGPDSLLPYNYPSVRSNIVRQEFSMLPEDVQEHWLTAGRELREVRRKGADSPAAIQESVPSPPLVLISMTFLDNYSLQESISGWIKDKIERKIQGGAFGSMIVLFSGFFVGEENRHLCYFGDQVSTFDCEKWFESQDYLQVVSPRWIEFAENETSGRLFSDLLDYLLNEYADKRIAELWQLEDDVADHALAPFREDLKDFFEELFLSQSGMEEMHPDKFWTEIDTQPAAFVDPLRLPRGIKFGHPDLLSDRDFRSLYQYIWLCRSKRDMYTADVRFAFRAEALQGRAKVAGGTETSTLANPGPLVRAERFSSLSPQASSSIFEIENLYEESIWSRCLSQLPRRWADASPAWTDATLAFFIVLLFFCFPQPHSPIRIGVIYEHQDVPDSDLDTLAGVAHQMDVDVLMDIDVLVLGHTHVVQTAAHDAGGARCRRRVLKLVYWRRAGKPIPVMRANWIYDQPWLQSYVDELDAALKDGGDGYARFRFRLELAGNKHKQSPIVAQLLFPEPAGSDALVDATHFKPVNVDADSVPRYAARPILCRRRLHADLSDTGTPDDSPHDERWAAAGPQPVTPWTCTSSAVEIGVDDDTTALRKNPFAMPTFDPSDPSSLARCTATRSTHAVTRTGAQAVIFPGTPTAATPPANNPSLYLGKTHRVHRAHDVAVAKPAWRPSAPPHPHFELHQLGGNGLQRPLEAVSAAQPPGRHSASYSVQRAYDHAPARRASSCSQCSAGQWPAIASTRDVLRDGSEQPRTAAESKMRCAEGVARASGALPDSCLVSVLAEILFTRKSSKRPHYGLPCAQPKTGLGEPMTSGMTEPLVHSHIVWEASRSELFVSLLDNALPRVKSISILDSCIMRRRYGYPNGQAEASRASSRAMLALIPAEEDSLTQLPENIFHGETPNRLRLCNLINVTLPPAGCSAFANVRKLSWRIDHEALAREHVLVTLDGFPRLETLRLSAAELNWPSVPLEIPRRVQNVYLDLPCARNVVTFIGDMGAERIAFDEVGLDTSVFDELEEDGTFEICTLMVGTCLSEAAARYRGRDLLIRCHPAHPMEYFGRFIPCIPKVREMASLKSLGIHEFYWPSSPDPDGDETPLFFPRFPVLHELRIFLATCNDHSDGEIGILHHSDLLSLDTPALQDVHLSYVLTNLCSDSFSMTWEAGMGRQVDGGVLARCTCKVTLQLSLLEVHAFLANTVMAAFSNPRRLRSLVLTGIEGADLDGGAEAMTLLTAVADDVRISQASEPTNCDVDVDIWWNDEVGDIFRDSLL
ncbi:hypothetical protein AURDEDRAFT_121232 [Auricularia subglabra TFB-10046 SS5]|nr:hypothetical protein AURDEDRAFT_121232 [Auricularia subglabra TFB-10046 SS5]